MSRFVFIAAILAATPAAAETRYFTGMDDLPLAPGMAEAGGAFHFEDAGGRITGAVAEGRARPDEVERFYLEALPALGWGRSPTDNAADNASGDATLVFRRGREKLTLVITSARIGAQAGAHLEARLFTRPAAMNAD